ncbi:MAG TPA: hypothetical protein VK978_03685 [Candidatus Saccharimonadales bacterium]|nr:hypothetical protein [Candidatus Saccharimonadales bacterium]
MSGRRTTSTQDIGRYSFEAIGTIWTIELFSHNLSKAVTGRLSRSPGFPGEFFVADNHRS